VVVDADAPEIPVGIDGETVMLPTPVRCAIRPGYSGLGCHGTARGHARPNPTLTGRPCGSWPRSAPYRQPQTDPLHRDARTRRTPFQRVPGRTRRHPDCRACQQVGRSCVLTSTFPGAALATVGDGVAIGGPVHRPPAAPTADPLARAGLRDVPADRRCARCPAGCPAASLAARGMPGGTG
jgi:hypothetical protein